MAYSQTSVTIHLINDYTNHSTDDNVRIRKILGSDDEFEVSYSDQNNGSPIVHTVPCLSRSGVMNYLYILLKNQFLDEEGYQKLQLSLPAMPRMIVSGDKFKQVYYREHFMEAVDTGLNLLDITMHEKKVKKVKKEEKMPPLVPLTSAFNYSYQTPPARRFSVPPTSQQIYFDDSE